MNIKTFKAVFPKADLITSPNSFFASIKYQYREYRKSGVYRSGEHEGLYIYQIITEFGTHTGILCATAVTDLKNKNMLMHEKTLAAKEQQMMHLLMQRKALVKPILLGYHPIDKTHKDLIKITENQKPEVNIGFEDGEKHKIWTIYDKTLINKLKKSFTSLDTAYIGDGHHRSTTIALLNDSKELGVDNKKYSHFLTAYFPFDQLQIWDYNRVVDITDIIPTSQLVAQLSTYFKIKILRKARKPNKKHELTLYIDNNWYSMKWKPKYIKKKNKVVLDSALTNKYIFKKILKIKDVRTDLRIKYYGGIEPIQKIMKQSQKFVGGVGICIYPVSVDELTQLANKHKTLPPKSTWFMPRLKSGIIAKDL